MARPGVGYSEVAAAASHLVGQGRNPTVEQVRLVIGSGSSTTIANHLRQWRNEQQGSQLLAAQANVPAELIEMVKGLWERVLNISQEKLDQAEAAFTQTLKEQGEELAKYKSNNQRWQQLFNQWSQEKDRLSSEIATLTAGNEAMQAALNKQANELHLKSEQCLEKDDRIQELRRLHTQTQANLEHFRESARVQREEEHQQFEQERQQWLIDNKRLSEALNHLKIQLHETAQRLSYSEEGLAQSKVKLDDLERQYKAMADKAQQTEAALTASQQTNTHLEKQLEQAHSHLDAKTIKLIDAESSVKFLTQQMEQIKEAMRDLQDQNKLLAHEKWVVSQEHAQLLGQMKQLDKHFKA